MMAQKGHIDIQKILDMSVARLRFEMVYLMELNQFSIQQFVEKAKSLQIGVLKNEMLRALSRPMTEARSLRGRVSTLSQLSDLLKPTKAGETKEINRQILNLDQTLKSSLSYPATLSLYYIIFKAGLGPDAVVEPAYSRFAAPHTFRGAIKKLLQGSKKAIFNFSVDDTPLNSFEMMESIELSVRSGLFQGLGFSIDDMMGFLFDMATAEEMSYAQGAPVGSLGSYTDLEGNYQNLQDKYASPEWSDVLKSCVDFKEGRGHDREMPLSHILLSPSLGYTSLFLDGDYSGLETANIDGQVIQKPGYFAMGRRHVTQLEIFRTDLLLSIRFFQNLQTNIEATTPEKLPKLAGKIGEAKEKIKSFITLLLQRTKEFDSCYFDLMKRDRVIVAEIIKAEAQFWGAVHQEMKKMRQDPKYASSINQHPLGYELPAGVLWRTRVSAQSATTYDFDFQLRVKDMIEHGMLLPSGKQNPLDPSLKLRLTSDEAKASLYKNAVSRTLPYVEDEKSFVSSAMKSNVYSGVHAYVQWFEESHYPVIGFQTFYDGHALLYRLSPMTTELLGLPELESAQALAELPIQLLNYFSLDPQEIEALGLLGNVRVFDFSSVTHSSIFMASNSQPEASHDYLMQILAQKWMGYFGDKDIMETPEVAVMGGRPDDLVPVETLAIRYFNYRSDTHQILFSQDLNNAAMFDQQYINFIKADYSRMALFKAQVLKEEQSIPFLMINFDARGPLKVNLYSTGVSDNLDSTFIQLKKTTGNFFQ